MASRDMCFLPKDSFIDSSHSSDNQNSKRGLRSPNFRHKQPNELPLIEYNWQNLPLVRDELRRCSVNDTDFGIWNAGSEDNAHKVHPESLDCAATLDFIKACGKDKDLLKGSSIHAHILKRGLFPKDIYVGTALISMYAKCGAPKKAQEVFDELSKRDVASWNALIAGYAQHGLLDEALNCFEQMQDDGLSPNAVSFVCILKACGSIGAVEKGEEIHAEVGRQGLLEKNIMLGTALADMYAKCGALTRAQEVFEELPTRDVVSWNVLIAGYAQHGLADEALNCFGRMQEAGLSPNAVTFVCILKACGSIGAIEKGKEIHEEVGRQGLVKKNVVLGTALVDMYAKCGELAKAQELFDELPVHNVTSWTALIAGYAHHGLGDKALNCLGQMRDQGLSPNTATFVCILQACGSIGAAEKGEEIHGEVGRQGLLEKHIVLGTALVDMYAKCGVLAKAQEVFDELPVRDVASWNALMSGYAQHGLSDEVLNCFIQMKDDGFSPNTVTFVCMLKACGNIGVSEKGEEIHAEISRQGLLEKSTMLGNALVDMYVKCSALAKAQKVLDEMPVRDVISWTALIAGYAQHGFGDEALNCFGGMRDEGFYPDAATFVCILRACCSIGAVEKGEGIHAEVGRQGLLEKHVLLGTAVVDMYVKCGALGKAQKVFDELPARDIGSWTVLMAGYAQHGLDDEALSCFERMQKEGLSPNAVTFACILKACGSIGATEMGEEIHVEVGRQELLEKNIDLGIALIDMYANCGRLSEAQEVFDKLPVRNVASWTALIAGYAQLGEVKRVFTLFRKMIGERIQPSNVTFIVLLTACSHAGLVEEGQMCFNTMKTVHCIVPTLEHHTCLVDLLSRAGHFNMAISVIEKVSPFDCLLLLSALLGACREWSNVELGRWAFEHAVKLDKYYAGAYVYMSNMYATAGMKEEPYKVEALRSRNRAWKISECCWWTDESRNVHLFTVRDKSHPKSKCVEEKLQEIAHELLFKGHSPCSPWVTKAISDGAKEGLLCGHSEKLTIACALINTPKGISICVTKNTRVCHDCHLATSLISKLEKRKIQVKDANRIHIFKDGKCICEE